MVSPELLIMEDLTNKSLIPPNCKKCCCKGGYLPSGEQCYIFNGFGYVGK